MHVMQKEKETSANVFWFNFRLVLLVLSPHDGLNIE